MDVDYRDAPSILQGLIGQEIHTITRPAQLGVEHGR